MRWIDRRTVRLNVQEARYREEFDSLLDRGYSIGDAVDHMMAADPAMKDLDPKFIEWLRS